MSKIIETLKAFVKTHPVILAALITAASSIAVALFTSWNLTLQVEATELEPATTGMLPNAEMNNRQSTELNNSITAATLHDLSNTRFNENAGPAAIKDSIRMLIHYADAHLEDRKHYAYRRFRLKKIMLNMPRRNINTRIEGTDPEALHLIQ
jgi:hypothetical protein